MNTDSHSTPAEGVNCMCCWDDISSANYVEYRPASGSAWLASGYCQTCIEELIRTQWQVYVSGIEKSTCRAEMKRLLGRGPPINLRDSKALACPDEGEVHELWYTSDNQIHSAKLLGSLEGEERDKFWKEKLEFFPNDEPDEEEAAA
jgi:hypothetical protein